MTPFEKDRLRHSIECRQNLVNYFESFFDRLYKPIKTFVDLDDKKEVEDYLSLTSVRLDSIREHFKTRGTKWQKERLWIGLGE